MLVVYIIIMLHYILVSIIGRGLVKMENDGNLCNEFKSNDVTAVEMLTKIAVVTMTTKVTRLTILT